MAVRAVGHGGVSKHLRPACGSVGAYKSVPAGVMSLGRRRRCSPTGVPSVLTPLLLGAEGFICCSVSIGRVNASPSEGGGIQTTPRNAGKNEGFWPRRRKIRAHLAHKRARRPLNWRPWSMLGPSCPTGSRPVSWRCSAPAAASSRSSRVVVCSLPLWTAPPANTHFS